MINNNCSTFDDCNYWSNVTEVPLESLCFISPCIYLHSDSGCTIGGYFFYYHLYLIAFEFQMKRNLYVKMLSVCEYTESEYMHRNITTFFFFAIKCGNQRKSRHVTFLSS